MYLIAKIVLFISLSSFKLVSANHHDNGFHEHHGLEEDVDHSSRRTENNDVTNIFTIYDDIVSYNSPLVEGSEEKVDSFTTFM